MKVQFTCSTNGKGCWSDKVKQTKVFNLYLNYNDSSQYGELHAKVTKKSWDINKYGLIYTDPQWLRDFRGSLHYLGLSKKASKDVDYSEQGMQGENFVSLDVGKCFLQEYTKIDKNTIDKSKLVC